MRYDDMIDTVLRAESSGHAQRLSVWSQLSDLLAQKGEDISSDRAAAALSRLSQLKPYVPAQHRLQTAHAIARRCHFVPIVAFYAGDSVQVAQAILSEVQLSDDEWLALIPQTTPVARAILRERRDLSSDTNAMLQAFGAVDFRLHDHVTSNINTQNTALLGQITGTEQVPGIEQTVPQQIAPPIQQPVTVSVNDAQRDIANNDIAITTAAAFPKGTQISELVRRIEAYRAEQQDVPDANTPAMATPFLFETDVSGNINWTNAPLRGAVIGLSLAEPAFDGDAGTDAYSAGAFRQRAAIQNARLTLEETSPMGGAWRFSAQPLFNPATGQFLGYKGNARRPRPGESASTLPLNKVLGPASFGDAMRQLVHELRTPLNAISGFAQIIDSQMFGPVPERYRNMADEIIADSDRLIAIFSDLDLAARLDSNTMQDETGQVGFDVIIDRISRELDRVSDERGVRLRLTVPQDLPLINASADQTHRLVGRFLSALVEVAARNELVEGVLHNISETHQLRLDVVRPHSISDVPEKTLLDPGYSPEGEAPDAAMLSLGFSLRLVSNFVRELGGSLVIGPHNLSLLLPAAVEQEDLESHIGS